MIGVEASHVDRNNIDEAFRDEKHNINITSDWKGHIEVHRCKDRKTNHFGALRSTLYLMSHFNTKSLSLTMECAW